jgi:hypothetical protein
MFWLLPKLFLRLLVRSVLDTRLGWFPPVLSSSSCSLLIYSYICLADSLCPYVFSMLITAILVSLPYFFHIFISSSCWFPQSSCLRVAGSSALVSSCGWFLSPHIFVWLVPQSSCLRVAGSSVLISSCGWFLSHYVFV